MLILTKRGKTKGWTRKFFYLTGFSSSGIFVFIVLHNAFYAFGELTKGIIIISQLMHVLHAAFFLISIIVCPLGYLIGTIGTIYIMMNKKSQ